jgi:hypothetical protein
MSNSNGPTGPEGAPIGNLLYTREAQASRRKAEEELKVADPKPERATAILSGDNEEEKDENESQSP